MIIKSLGYLNFYMFFFLWFIYSYFNFKIIGLFNSFFFIWFVDIYFCYNRSFGSLFYILCYLMLMCRFYQCLNMILDSCWYILYCSYFLYMNCYYNQIYIFLYLFYMCDLYCCFDIWNYSLWCIYFYNNFLCKLKKKRIFLCLF